MIYVTSDLHGISVTNFKALLSKGGFGAGDFLIVLGDVIDRGTHGIELLRWLMIQPNAELLLGNHEAMMLSCEFLLDEITDENVDKLDSEKIAVMSTWLSNGGMPTLSALRELNSVSRSAVLSIYGYLREAPLYEAVTAGGRDFILTHAGLGNFRSDKRISDYTADELIWNRPRITDRYYEGIITVFGHTPTEYFGAEYRGRALHTPTWIDIDTGAASGLSPCLLRLDDLQEFYL